MSEKLELQDKIEKYLDKLDIRYLHIENNHRQQKLRKNKYKKYKGFPDNIIFVKGGQPLIFEYKLNYNVLSKEQIEWEDYLFNKKYYFYVVKSYKQGKNIIDLFV